MRLTSMFLAILAAVCMTACDPMQCEKGHNQVVHHDAWVEHYNTYITIGSRKNRTSIPIPQTMDHPAYDSTLFVCDAYVQKQK